VGRNVAKRTAAVANQQAQTRSIGQCGGHFRGQACQHGRPQSFVSGLVGQQ
jgi:hypothetical protein